MLTSGLLSLLETDTERSLFCAAAGKVDIASSSADVYSSCQTATTHSRPRSACKAGPDTTL